MIKLTEQSVNNGPKNTINNGSNNALSLIKSDLVDMKEQLKNLSEVSNTPEMLESLEISLLKLKIAISTKIKSIKKISKIKDEIKTCIEAGEVSLKELTSKYESDMNELYSKNFISQNSSQIDKKFTIFQK